MHTTTRIRRTLATALLSLGLAYPACAAVCPKGIGGCTSPGRCSLFTDTDGNTLCDYSGRSGSSTTGGSTQSVLPTESPDTIHDTTAQVSVSTTPSPGTGAGTTDLISSSAILLGALTFAILATVLYFAFRKGIMGLRSQQPGPAGALSILIALGISLMVTHNLIPDTIPVMTCALLYAATGSLLTAYLWHAGALSRPIILVIAAVSVATGFVLLAPLMPLEFAAVVSIGTGTSGPTLATGIILTLILLAIIFGRTFCGHLCPVGSLQELAYAVPGKKLVYGRTGWPEWIRLAVFIIATVAALFLVDLMEYTGLYQFFSLTLTAGFWIGLGLVLISAFFYRPVCRILCPFGMLFSLAAACSRFRLRRSGSCIGCDNCTKVCPVNTAGGRDSKRECYLCGRCTAACPIRGALHYGR